MSPITASTGWAWLKQGAGMFRKQPAGLTTLLFADILISVLIGVIPVAGAMVAIMLVPCFSMAFMQACLLIDQGKRVTPDVLLTGFRQPAVKTLLKVGLVYLGVFFVLAMVMRFAVDPDILRQAEGASAAGGDPATMPRITGGDMLGLLMIFLLQAITVLTLSFTAPLTYWQKMATGKAVFYSFFAVMRTARAFIVLLASWFVILFGLCILVAMLLGQSSGARIVIMWLFFLFFLLLQCALYCAYRQIFGTPVAEPVSLTKI
jgi:hypothetical protein